MPTTVVQLPHVNEAEPHHIEVDPCELDSINEHRKIARVKPAKKHEVVDVLNQSTEGHDGRSNFMWVRLHDGTLILGVFPQGSTYIKHSDSGCCDFWD